MYCRQGEHPRKLGFSNELAGKAVSPFVEKNDSLNEGVENPEAIKLPHYCSSSSAGTIKVDAGGRPRAPRPHGRGWPGREPEATTQDFGR
jgi:hypothetical protein